VAQTAIADVKKRIRDLGPQAIAGHEAPVHIFALVRKPAA
jgi:hypothetical protein